LLPLSGQARGQCVLRASNGAEATLSRRFPVRGWAATAHIPALRALPNYEIRAISAHSAESARAAGEVFEVSAVFSDHEQMVTQPDIDVVAVTVKVTHHRELVTAALAAGKAVYCEWPLGRDLNDARAMAALAAEQGLRTVVGLQARQAPAIEFVQELLSDGYVGEVLSTTMVGLSVPGDVVGQPNAYMLDKTNGANVLTIAVGHSLDTLNYVLGEFAELSAISDLRRPLITIEETGKQIVKTAADQIAVIGTLTSGATASVHVREAVAGGTGFLWEINGTNGTLRITADAAYPEIYPLTLWGARGRNEPAELAAPAALTQKWPALTSLQGTPAYNVGRAYAAFAADTDNGTHTVPDFADAVKRHEVISAGDRWPSGIPCPVDVSSHRSASSRRASTPSTSPLTMSAPAYPMLSTGLTRISSSGSASSQRRSVAYCRPRRSAGIASSTRSAARSKSSLASA
jgi:predicted dehydrogenase